MRNTRWIYKNINSTDERVFNSDVEQILYNRGVQTSYEMETFIHGDLKSLINPNDLKDVDKAVTKLIKSKDKKIWIYGDYDVDGITSTSLCFLALKELGFDVNYYIPLRDEGYGLNKQAIEYIKQQNGEIIITVDCGVSSIEEVDYCNSLGMDIIITDHHDITSSIPNAFAVINPKRIDNKIDCGYLAGVGTAFMLLLALYKKLNCMENIYKYLDIVAIGTIADIVPLKNQNRLFVKYGLNLLKSSYWKGLNMLLKQIYDKPLEKTFNTYDVGFVIAPIFNAAGRLEDAKIGVELLTTNSHIVADKLIYKMINKNNERKDIQNKILEDAIQTIEKERLFEDSVIIVAKENYHHGVIGIVASNILDRYYKPTIVMEIKAKQGIATASCRSIENFNMIESLSSMKELFLKFGGHSGAAGFSIAIENIPQFKNRLNSLAKEKIDVNDLKKPIKIDCEISPLKVSYDFLNRLSYLEPYGFGNPSPIFVMKNCSYTNLRTIGKNKNHLMFNLIKNGIEIKNCVWFNSDDVFTELLNTKNIDIAFKLKSERYLNRYQSKIYIEDVKATTTNSKIDIMAEFWDIFNIEFPLKAVIYTKKDFEITDKLTFGMYNKDIAINLGHKTIGFLDLNTSKLLQKLSEYYGYKYKIQILNIIKESENNNVYLSIDVDKTFKTLAIKTGKIFSDIKDFLIGKMEYNSFQKNILKEIFKNNKKVIVNDIKGRGLNTVLKTIELYFNSIGKKIIVVNGEEKIIPENFDFKIYIGNNPSNYADFDFIITKNDFQLPTHIFIEDNYIIPENIKIVGFFELKKYNNIYSKILPTAEKINIIDEMKKGKNIYATEDIKVIF